MEHWGQFDTSSVSPVGQSAFFSGWPDFQIYQRFSQEERRLGVNLGLEETVRAVGDIQSPPGTSRTAKNRTFAQAGIYTVGQFGNTSSLTKLATVILYKDITAHVALATINRAKDSKEVIGDVTYKLVNSVNVFDLKVKEDLQAFSSVFVTALKTTLL